MSWVTPTSNDVLTCLAGPELIAYQTAAKAVGQTDPLPEILANVVDEARGYIAAGSGNKLDVDGTIPGVALAHVLAIIRFRLITRLPIAVKEDRREAYRDAIKFLQGVASGDIRIEDPATGVMTRGYSTLLNSRPVLVTSAGLRGL